MITREVDYAIRTVLSLAQRGQGVTSVSTADLAKEMLIPFRFLRRIVRKLVEAGIISSQRGNGGGIALLLPPDRVSLLSIVAAIDERSVKLNTCLVEKSNCPRSVHCRVHVELHRLQDVLNTHLGAITMDQLVSKKS